MLRRCLVSGVCFSFFLVFACAGARAQRVQGMPGIFVTPVPNTPFRGVIKVQRSFVQKNGTMTPLKSTPVIWLVARDSAGRVRREARQSWPAPSTGAPEPLGVLIYDPQTRVSTALFPRQKMYRSMVVNQPPSTEPPGQMDASGAGANLPLNQFTKREDLGTQEIDGLQVHGVRETQTLPASGGGQPVVVTDEYWYSDYLHLNVVMKHIDPRTGSVTTALTQVSQEEPDPSLFVVPDGYKPLSIMAVKRSK
jgi:hypothetical protein